MYSMGTKRTRQSSQTSCINVGQYEHYVDTNYPAGKVQGMNGRMDGSRMISIKFIMYMALFKVISTNIKVDREL